jgi:hypothetical protein
MSFYDFIPVYLIIISVKFVLSKYYLHCLQVGLIVHTVMLIIKISQVANVFFIFKM